MLTDFLQSQTYAALQQIPPVHKQLRNNSKLSMGKANTIKL